MTIRLLVMVVMLELKVVDEKDVHLSRRPQKAGLIAKKTPTNVLAKYANSADVFSLILELTTMLSSWSIINNHPRGSFIA